MTKGCQNDPYRECRLCPRGCGVDRVEAETTGVTGFCDETARLRVGYVGPHFGEEPPITGQNGSGTVFFSGCTLKCSYCQNHQISWGGLGQTVPADQLLKRVKAMVRLQKVHNLNFVTPDHFLPHVTALVTRLREEGVGLPVVLNLSGYQSLPWLRQAESSADIYLPDFKYSDGGLAGRLSRCRDYPKTALEAIGEMIRQKGFLDSCVHGDASVIEADLAQKGVLVRHLILPGHVKNSIDVLTSLYLEFGRELPLSIMSQYYPAVRQKDAALNRTLTLREFDEVYAHATALGFENMFVQFPEHYEASGPSSPALLPDFRKAEPFS